MKPLKAGFAFACALLCVIVALSAPALADDAELKKQVERINSAYVDNFNKQNAAGIVPLFATGGIFVNQFGPRTNMLQVVEGTFKAGFNHMESKVDQVWPLGPDTAIGMGQVRFTGKSQNGTPIETSAFWTATYVREGGTWKVRMLSGITKAPPPAK